MSPLVSLFSYFVPIMDICSVPLCIRGCVLGNDSLISLLASKRWEYAGMRAEVRLRRAINAAVRSCTDHYKAERS